MSKNVLQKYEGDKADKTLKKAGNGLALIGVGFVAGTFGITFGLLVGAGYGIWRGAKWFKNRED